MLKDRQNNDRLPHIPHNQPTLTADEAQAAAKVILSGWVAQGSEVEKFENEFCDFLNIPSGSAVAVSSGTAALYLSLRAIGATNQLIAAPIYTCSAISHAIHLAGGRQLLIDSALDSPSIDLNKLNTTAKITIIPHMHGLPQDLTNILNDHIIIEDCAQSLGARINKLPVGLQGDIAVYSFYATKLMTTGGQGGMIVAKDKAIIDFIKDYRMFDQRKDGKQRFNFQMTDLQATIGRVQLRKFPQFKGAKEHFPHAYQWSEQLVSLPIYPTLN